MTGFQMFGVLSVALVILGLLLVSKRATFWGGVCLIISIAAAIGAFANFVSVTERIRTYENLQLVFTSLGLVLSLVGSYWLTLVALDTKSTNPNPPMFLYFFGMIFAQVNMLFVL